MQIELSNTQLLVCSIHRPENAVHPFWENLRNSISNASDISSNIDIVCNINVDMLTLSPNRVLSEIINMFSFINVIDQPTRSS